MRTRYRDADVQQGEPFGRWLTSQSAGTSEAMDMLIAGAKRDGGFPNTGDADTVREHLGRQGADPDLFEAVDDAELSWLAV